MLHQRAQTGEVQISPGGYGGAGCGTGIVAASLTTGMESGAMASSDLSSLSLAVDVAASPDGKTLAIVSAGNDAFTSVFTLSLEDNGDFRRAAQPVPQSTPRAAAPSAPIAAGGAASKPTPSTSMAVATPQCANGRALSRNNPMKVGKATAVAWVSADMIAVQVSEPATIEFLVTNSSQRTQIDLQQASRLDSGHVTFHSRTGSGLACASCHPEAGDDGHVWEFAGIGPRRTQALRGGVLGTEPFHWNGDMADFNKLVHEVFEGRMLGAPLTPEYSDALAQWIDKQAPLRTVAADKAAVERGQELFESAAVGCATCHSGAHLTNNQSEDVGTGARLQVPSLRGVAFRAPLMHDGCAASLTDRFGPCGGGDKHGHTSQLNAAQLGDLVAYLETL